MNYYFLAASLPPLAIGERPDITFEELCNRLSVNLWKDDLQKTEVFRRLIDITNIRLLYLEESIDPRGNLNEKELDEALLLQVGLPEYVFDFLGRYENVADRVRYFSGLLAAFFREEIPRNTGFLHDYLVFERGWRLVLVALRAKSLGRDVALELQFEDFHDPLVAQILAQKDGGSYEPPPEFMALKEALISCSEDPWELHRAFAKWRFERIGELVEKPPFSIDWILSYMAQLMIVEDWNALDKDRGKTVLDTFRSG